MKFVLTLLTCFLLSFSAFANERVVLTGSNFIIMDTEFNSATTGKLMAEVLQLTQNKLIPAIIPYSYEKPTIYLIMETPGGEVSPGLKMIDFLLSQQYEFKTITFYAASMGFIAVQFLGERLITPSGILMAHRAKGGIGGELGYSGKSQFDSRSNFIKRRLKRIDEQIIKRTKSKQNLVSYQKLYENEYYCEGQDCKKDGFVDKVVDLTCDGDLSDTIVQKTNINFFGLSLPIIITTSECPIVGIIKVEIDQNKNGTFLDLYDRNVDKDLRNKVKIELKLK